MEPLEALLLWTAAFVAGAINAVAGGGSFFTFPALLFAGIPSVAANATSNTALWPASIASAFGYREELRAERKLFIALAITSLVGSTAGAILLVTTPTELFDRIFPFLMLVASVVFTFGGRIRGPKADTHRMSTALVCVALLPVSIYGGYFGGGQGFMMLAVFSLAGLGNIHAMNAFKSVLAGIHNGVGVVVFVVAGAVVWTPALVMAAGAIPGGYAGARWARRVSPGRVRVFVIVVAWVMTGWFFARATW